METKSAAIWTAIIGAIAVIVAALVTSLMPNQSNGQVSVKDENVTSKSIPDAQFPFYIDSYYVPSGWMGDGEFGKTYLQIKNEELEVDGELVPAIRIEYLPGPKKWAGIYWQFPRNNWGDLKGKNLSGAKNISFLAKGNIGGEIAEFKIGGIRGQYPDSLEKSTGKLILSPVWKEYSLNVKSEDLKNVIGGFAWISESKPDRTPVVIYLANIVVK